MKLLRISILALAATITVGAGFAIAQEKEQAMDKIHFLIPGGAGGGWDGTARGVGEALKNSGLVETVTFENMSGGGGGKALNYIVENAQSNEGTLMVHSTPIIVRALNKTVNMGYRDVTPVAGVIGDYAAIVVGKNSDYEFLGATLCRLPGGPPRCCHRWRLGAGQHGSPRAGGHHSGGGQRSAEHALCGL